jgi:EmrB/QacA subfamily drug resistance transporter
MQNNAQVARQGLSYKWLVVIVVIIGAFMVSLDQTVVNIAIPRLQNAFGADIHTVQWVITAYTLALGAMTPASSYLATRFGIKRSYILALIAFTLGSVLCGLSLSLPMLIFFRVLQGLGGAVLLPLSITLLFRGFGPEERGVALGMFGVPVLLAPALGPIIGGYLVTYVSWQFIFFINVPIGAIGVIMALLILRESQTDARAPFDLAGFLTAAYGVAAVLYAVSETTTEGWGSTRVLAFLVSGAISLIIFVVLEMAIIRRGGRPLLNLRLFADGSFGTGNIALVLASIAVFGGFFLVPVYLQILRGQSAFQAGLILLPQALGAMVSVVAGGRLVDKFGFRFAVIPGLLLLGFTSWQLTSMTLNSPFGWLELMLTLFGLSFGLALQPLVVAAMARMREAQDIADASTLTTVTRSVAQSVGVALLATLVDTQRQIHFAHLAEQVTAASPLGQMMTRLQALFVSRGADVQASRQAVAILVSTFLQKQGYMLALHDAFYLSIILVALALLAALFVKGQPRRTQAPVPSDEAGSDVRQAEPIPVG